MAKKSGIIDELDVRKGQNMVKPKEFVQKGDLLVSGAIDSNVQGIRYVRSYGEIYAFTEEEKSKEYKMERIEKTATGKTKKKFSLINGEKEIKLYVKDEPGYKNYERKETKKTLFFGIVLRTDIYSEQEVKRVKRSEKETFDFGKSELVEELKKEFGKYFDREDFDEIIDRFYVMHNGKMYGTSFLLEGDDIPWESHKLTININTNTECDFTITSYNGDEKQELDYRLKVIDGNWKFTGTFHWVTTDTLVLVDNKE